MTLKECPFCKHTESGIEKRVEFSNKPLHVECYACGARGPMASTPDEAAELWNRRGGE